MDAPGLVAIVGPTASGKSCLAVCLAKRFGGEILNCDSLQMFRHLDIGSAKPSAAEREGIPHHFFDILEPDEQFAAGEYMRQAREGLAGGTARGKSPLLVGGGGVFVGGRCWVVCRPGRSATRNCAVDCNDGPNSAARVICTGC